MLLLCRFLLFNVSKCKIVRCAKSQAIVWIVYLYIKCEEKKQHNVTKIYRTRSRLQHTSETNGCSVLHLERSEASSINTLDFHSSLLRVESKWNRNFYLHSVGFVFIHLTFTAQIQRASQVQFCLWTKENDLLDY